MCGKSTVWATTSTPARQLDVYTIMTSGAINKFTVSLTFQITDLGD